MAARVQVEPLPGDVTRRSRGVWTVLMLSSVAFLLLCAGASAALSGYLSNVTQPQTATLEIRTHDLHSGSQLSVQRRGSTVSEVVTATTTLREGDAASTGPDTEAFIGLFDGSSIQTSFDTSIEIEALRTSRFFQSLKEASILLRSGTVVVRSAEAGSFSSASYTVTTDQGEITLGGNSKVRIRIEDTDGSKVAYATVDFGSATLLSAGKKVELKPGTMGWATGRSAPEGPTPAEEELVSNGNFAEAPTSGAGLPENGGLGTAAWLPVREQTAESTPLPAPVWSVGPVDVVQVVTETLSPLGVINAVSIGRQSDGEHYAKVGIHQDINRTAEFFNSLELAATVKVFRQQQVVGGPQANLYPLTISVNYRDSERVQHEWRQSFYYVIGRPAADDPGQVPLAAWTTRKFTLKKSPDVGQDIAIIDSIDIYGYGAVFQSWVTNVSLVAR